MSRRALALAPLVTAGLVAVAPAHAGDGKIALRGLRHDSRDVAYRAPGGAVPSATAVRIRLRAFAGDLASARLRVFDVVDDREQLVAMRRVQRRVSCREPALARRRCDFWQATLSRSARTVLWYRFIARDGRATAYYADDSQALDGGPGESSRVMFDRSWALTVYERSFTTPAWARSAVVYQIFPDRFRNGEPANDPRTGDPRYDDPVLALPWTSLPEGYCRGYAGGSCGSQPRGRDYMGGDLQGVIDRLDYLRELGVTAIYFNPIFAARSNHRYDTADFRAIDPYLGDLSTFERLVSEARARGIRVILDGVFNHMSSDSPFFDRYRRYSELGACESGASPWRSWFIFQTSATGPCAASAAGNDRGYASWFNFDSLPVLAKGNPAVVDYFVRAADSVARLWLRRGAAGWRLDVMGDESFGTGYWELFRSVVKETDPQALIVGELWQKDSTLLRSLAGDRADSTMNYRLRDAVLGLLAPRDFDAKGFPASGTPLPPTQFASRLASIYEDYPPQAAAVLMNILDSHDTERILWTLTPGEETRAAKEQNAANLAEGKRRLQLASLIQFTVPGMPTVYYGDEVGVTGDDDPDDRRTYPWTETGGNPDIALHGHYAALARLRARTATLVDGDLRVLLASNRAGTVAYARRGSGDTTLVVVNRSRSAQAVAVPVAGSLADGSRPVVTYEVAATGAQIEAVNAGRLRVTLPALSAVVLVGPRGA